MSTYPVGNFNPVDYAFNNSLESRYQLPGVDLLISASKGAAVSSTILSKGTVLSRTTLDVGGPKEKDAIKPCMSGGNWSGGANVNINSDGTWNVGVSVNGSWGGSKNQSGTNKPDNSGGGNSANSANNHPQ